MLVLNPSAVAFGSATWSGVWAIAVDRRAARLVEARGDRGPHAVLVDVPEQRVRVRVVQRFTRDEPTAPRPGEMALLRFTASPGGSDALRRRVSVMAVVLRVEHEIARGRGATRMIELAGVSVDGAADPVSVADAAGEGP